MAERVVDVLVEMGGEEVLAGRLWAHRGRRNTESQSFAYDPSFVGRKGAYPLDPRLPLVSGTLHTAPGRAIFGAFADCAPDRWGRRLIGRAESKRVKREGGAARSFGETDYLLGVRDDLRQGALRFRDPGSGEFLAVPEEGVPALVDLPRLLSAAERVERDEESDEELEALLRGGSSLGGARPKAHLLAERGRIAIAKFPSPVNDDWDVMRWEAVALGLAREAGISVPDSELYVIDGKAVLAVDRFDRTGAQRIGYASAMTMLEATDGDPGSYLDIAAVIEERSAAATADLQELWRRIAFSVLISNFDDHLRNHGFLRASSAGWRLSPAFDLNPDPRGGERHLNTAIDEADTSASAELVMQVAAEFRLDQSRALQVLGEVYDATSRWQEVARSRGVGEEETELMAPAFEHEAKGEARQLLGR